MKMNVYMCSLLIHALLSFLHLLINSFYSFQRWSLLHVSCSFSHPRRAESAHSAARSSLTAPSGLHLRLMRTLPGPLTEASFPPCLLRRRCTPISSADFIPGWERSWVPKLYHSTPASSSRNSCLASSHVFFLSSLFPPCPWDMDQRLAGLLAKRNKSSSLCCNSKEGEFLALLCRCCWGSRQRCYRPRASCAANMSTRCAEPDRPSPALTELMTLWGR